jgi:hypothetical protein
MLRAFIVAALRLALRRAHPKRPRLDPPHALGDRLAVLPLDREFDPGAVVVPAPVGGPFGDLARLPEAGCPRVGRFDPNQTVLGPERGERAVSPKLIMRGCRCHQTQRIAALAKLETTKRRIRPFDLFRIEHEGGW